MRTIDGRPLLIKRDFGNHLLMQIEMLRCAISDEELSNRLGDITEHCLARYIAGKTHPNHSAMSEQCNVSVEYELRN